MTGRRSIRRRLALSATGLVLMVVALIAGIAYREVRATAVQAAGEHLVGVSRQLSEMFGASAPPLFARVTAVAKDTEIIEFARTPANHMSPAIAGRLQSLPGATASTAAGGSAELWDSTGKVLAATREMPRLSPELTRALIARVTDKRDTPSATAGAVVSPLDSVGDAIGYQVIAPVLAADGKRLGFVVVRRLIAGSTQGTAQIAALIGSESVLRLGNSSGGLWTDLSHAVAGPPPTDRVVSGVVEYARPDGNRVLSAITPIANTPWSVAVESPKSVALAVVHNLLWRLGIATFVLVLLAAAGAWLVSGTFTRPIARLAEAAAAISAGHYGERLPVEWRDELGRFTSAFNNMAEQISATLGNLNGKVGELKDAEARYRLLFEASPQPMWVYDVETYRFLAVNDAAIQHYGYSRDAFREMSIMDIRPTEDVPALLEDLDHGGINGQAKSQMWRHRTAGGAVIDVEVNSRSLNFDGRPARLILVNDLTDRYRAEAAARDAHDRLQRVIASSAAVLFELRLEATGPVLEWISENVTRILGYSSDEAYEDGWWRNNVHPTDLARLPSPDGAEAGRSVANEYRFRRKDGEYSWIREEHRPVRDHRTGQAKMVGAWFDITTQRSLESQLQQSQKMEAVGRLAGGVAHDFNNLLTVMLAECQYIEAEPDLTPEQRDQSVVEIRKAAERAALLTRQLLTFSRQKLVEADTIDMNEVVSDVDKMLRRLIGEDIELRTRLSTAPAITVADRGQVEQIIVNLAVNARDAMANGGSITIETELVTLDRAYRDSHVDVPAGRYVLLAVSDTGTGMTEEVQAHVFEPFFTTKSAGNGTGLGLATCYAIARRFGGHIALYTELGIGTTMKVYLPYTGAAIPASPARHAETRPGGSETILLVEDDPAVRRSVSRMLTSRGYVVVPAEDGEQACALVNDGRDQPIDLLLTDVVLPKMGGRAIAEEITRRCPGIRVLFMSGYSDDIVLQHRLTERNVLLIQKPFTSEALLEKVREALSADPVATS
jgi:two-component system cell cycle sensor histidine kinase/response regulator CckA